MICTYLDNLLNRNELQKLLRCDRIRSRATTTTTSSIMDQLITFGYYLHIKRGTSKGLFVKAQSSSYGNEHYPEAVSWFSVNVGKEKLGKDTNFDFVEYSEEEKFRN